MLAQLHNETFVNTDVVFAVGDNSAGKLHLILLESRI